MREIFRDRVTLYWQEDGVWQRYECAAAWHQRICAEDGLRRETVIRVREMPEGLADRAGRLYAVGGEGPALAQNGLREAIALCDTYTCIVRIADNRAPGGLGHWCLQGR